MNTRLQQFMTAENLSQSQFADRIGVARASISHIIAGRNKPGFDFILSMAKTFPSLNLDWLITGKGRMYKHSAPVHEKENEENGKLMLDFSDDDYYESGVQTSNPNPVTASKQASAPADSPVQTPARITLKTSPKQRNISHIIVFFDDNTFQELH